ncbi:MAG: DmsC/YnfH family molybdoenzyme membrane anchor subunit, partial [Kiloniellales bacterium]|nr:DmsC/YnfH family molybdoenzyme membrane anchor subunit [Kiloniellales bacterium]
MHPASSILVFTTASGAGYGLLFLFGLSGALQLVPPARWLGLVGLGLALGLIALGLAASTFHLKHPERAWRALSQWRSSWLSREGVSALVTFGPAGLFAVGWVGLEDTGGIWALFGLLAAAGAVVTVYCTGQIYASLTTIRQWHHPMVVPIYLALALATGALWLTALLRLFGWPALWPAALALAAVLFAWGLKFLYWQNPPDAGPSLETATGLGAFGRVRPLDSPHTESNYLMTEMGYRVARKHAERLRRLALLFGAGIPAAVLVLLFAVGGPFGVALAILAAISGLLGAFVERWLFFAEAS